MGQTPKGGTRVVSSYAIEDDERLLLFDPLQMLLDPARRRGVYLKSPNPRSA
jgi:hypothetical protein